jgi:4-hydroxythreonine-4-phosphate dehydrogenase
MAHRGHEHEHQLESTVMKVQPVIGLMLGDMTGIGPEISARVLAAGSLKPEARIVVIGDARVLQLGCTDAGVELARRTYGRVSDIDWSRDEIPVIDLGNIDPATMERGVMSPDSGRLSGDTLKHMIDLALAGELDGICFAPLNKGALHRGGWKYHDEHQMFAALTQHEGFFGEMNAIKEFATFRVTSHVALRDAVNLVTPERITSAVRLANTTLKATGIAAPRIAVAALNPHGGEGGLFGDEEIRIIRPTVERLHAEGIDCTGPISSDVIFLKALKQEYDGVVMMYHDQGQIATKLLGFNRGVTVTAGLKVVFATPAHGTAFDIVGQGKANPGGLEHALHIATRMATRMAAARIQ